MSMYRNIKRALGMFNIPFPFTPQANETHQSSIMAAGVFELGIPKGAYEVLVQANGDNVRYTLDGTDPSASSGFRLTAGNDPIAIPVIQGRTRIKVVREADGSVLEYQFGE